MCVREYLRKLFTSRKKYITRHIITWEGSLISILMGGICGRRLKKDIIINQDLGKVKTKGILPNSDIFLYILKIPNTWRWIPEGKVVWARTQRNYQWMRLIEAKRRIVKFVVKNSMCCIVNMSASDVLEVSAQDVASRRRK